MRQSIFVYGFAIFAMFFGSGNLVFPLSIGYSSANQWILGFFGLFLTGILLPFLGLFVIKLHKGDWRSFFGEAGLIAEIFIPFFTLSLLGSFGIVPRCISVAYGGFNYIFPHLSLFNFALIFSIISFFLCLKDKFMVRILGKWMSPILLITLLILIICGILKNPYTSGEIAKSEAFTTGFLTGYQTMDLLAAFFFSSLIFKQIQNSMPGSSDKQILRFACKASLVGSGLLSIIYLGFVYLGSHYASLLTNTPPEHMLPTIARYVMGDSANLFFSLSILFSCLTTAVALNNIYANYLWSTLKLKEDKFPVILALTTLISFLISMLDFKGISAFLSPALEISYPGLIFLTITGIMTRNYPKFKIYIFWAITLIMSFKVLIA